MAEVIEANPGQVEQYRAGKGKVLVFFVGQLMKERRQGEPQQLNALLKAALGEPGSPNPRCYSNREWRGNGD